MHSTDPGSSSYHAVFDQTTSCSASGSPIADSSQKSSMLSFGFNKSRRTKACGLERNERPGVKKCKAPGKPRGMATDNMPSVQHEEWASSKKWRCQSAPVVRPSLAMEGPQKLDDKVIGAQDICLQHRKLQRAQADPQFNLAMLLMAKQQENFREVMQQQQTFFQSTMMKIGTHAELKQEKSAKPFHQIRRDGKQPLINLTGEHEAGSQPQVHKPTTPPAANVSVSASSGDAPRPPVNPTSPRSTIVLPARQASTQHTAAGSKRQNQTRGAGAPSASEIRRQLQAPKGPRASDATQHRHSQHQNSGPRKRDHYRPSYKRSAPQTFSQSPASAKRHKSGPQPQCQVSSPTRQTRSNIPGARPSIETSSVPRRTWNPINPPVSIQSMQAIIMS